MKIGLIGYGLQGNRRARALQELNDVELVTVADIDREKAKLLANKMECQIATDWMEVVSKKDVEAVLICTPPHLHALIAIEASGKGKHILCEKPLARSLEEAGKMVEVASENGVKVKCGFNLRHHPGIQQARRWISEGNIGDLLFIRSRYGIGGRPGYEED
ncbi:Gfo/Idh/MocA family protein [Chloroflexota bacterium]